MELKYSLQFILDHTTWNKYFLSVRNTHLSQSWHYGDAKTQSQDWNVIRGILTENGEPIALVQAWYKKILFVKLVRVSYGPLWIIENPTTQQIKAVFKTIKQQWGLKKLCLLSIAPNLENTLENNLILKKLRFCKRKSMSFESGLIDLTLSVDTLRAQLRQNWRNQLKSSEKNTLQFQVSQTHDDFKWIMICFEILRKEKNFYGHSAELLTAFYHNSCENHEVWISIVSHNDERIAGMLFARSGSSCVPLIIWVCKKGRTLNAGNFLFWNSVLFAKNKGCLQFDLGGTNNSTAFKTGLPHKPYQLIGEYIGLF